MGGLALLMVLVAVMDFSARGFLYLLFAGTVSVYALLEKISYGCLIDHGTGQLTIFQRNTFGQTHCITCSLPAIRTIQVKRRVSGRGRPCSAGVTSPPLGGLTILTIRPMMGVRCALASPGPLAVAS